MKPRPLAFSPAPLARLVVALAVSAALFGCGASASGPSRPAIVFPTTEEVAQLPSRKAAPEAFGGNTIAVDSWTFESVPIPDDAAYEDSSLSGQLLRDQVKAHAATTALSPPLRCMAQELARFHRKKQAMPAENLRRFMAARCGSIAPTLSPLLVFVQAPLNVPDDQIAEQFRPDLARLIGNKLGTGHHLVGAAVARDAEGVSIAEVVAEDEARLEPGGRAVDDKRQVTLRGGVRGDFLEIGAMVNRGDSAAVSCTADPSVRPPRFAVQCELAPSDHFAWVEVVGRKRDSLLVHEIAETLIYEGDGKDIAYAPRRIASSPPVHSDADVTSALVDGLNGVRRAANLAPLTLATKQSAQNVRLAGTLISAMVSNDDGTAERAALGLLAGWDVDGLIRSGNFFVAAVAPEHEPTAWLDFALERPIGRASLLDPEARQIAVGPVLPEGAPGLGIVTTTYAFFQSEDHRADEDRFFARLAAARRALGLPAPVRITGFQEMRPQCERVLREGKPSMEALQEMMGAAATQTGKAVAGYVLETNDLSRVDVPRQLLGNGPLELILGVTHHRAPSAAWGQYVVFAIVLRGTPEMVASNGAGREG